MRANSSNKVIFTLDVEDWFTNGRSIKINQWDNYPVRVDKNIRRFLALLEETGYKRNLF